MKADQLRDLAAATYLTALRAKRSNPSCRAKKKQFILPSKERVDCFVAYAPRNDGRQLRDLAAATYLTSLRANGLRECAPYDRLLAMTAGASELRLHFSNSIAQQTRLRDLAARFRASFAGHVPLSAIRGRRECRARNAPAASHAVKISTRVSHHGHTGT